MGAAASFGGQRQSGEVSANHAVHFAIVCPAGMTVLRQLRGWFPAGRLAWFLAVDLAVLRQLGDGQEGKTAGGGEGLQGGAAHHGAVRVH